MATTFFGGSFFAGEFFNSPVVAPQNPSVGGGKARKRTRYLAKIEGKEVLFESLGELQEYLYSLKEEKIEEVAEKVKVGAVRIGKAPPKIKVTKATAEVKAVVAEYNEEIRQAFWNMMASIQAANDEEDLLLLS